MPWDFWLIFVVLGVLIPWRGRERLKHLLAQPAFGTKEKLLLYGATIAFQWLLCGLVAWRALARGLTAAELGLARRIDFELVAFSLIGAVLLCTFQCFNLRRVGRIRGPMTELMRKLAERLLPSKAVEFGPYCALAVTAGVCEEFLYRGFAMSALNRAGAPAWSVLVMSSVLFGLAHAYQGRGGVIGTGLLGFIFGGMRLAVGSLFPVILWHAGVDIVAGVAGPKFLLQQGSSDEASSA